MSESLSIILVTTLLLDAFWMTWNSPVPGRVLLEVSSRSEGLLAPPEDALGHARLLSPVLQRMRPEFHLRRESLSAKLALLGSAVGIPGFLLHFGTFLVRQLEMLPEVVTIVEQRLAAAVTAPEDSRRARLVAGHVAQVVLVLLDALAAQLARERGGGVRPRLVLVQIEGQLAGVRAARVVAGVRFELGVPLHVRRQVAFFVEPAAANVTCQVRRCKVHLEVRLHLSRRVERE